MSLSLHHGSLRRLFPPGPEALNSWEDEHVGLGVLSSTTTSRKDHGRDGVSWEAVMMTTMVMMMFDDGDDERDDDDMDDSDEIWGLHGRRRSPAKAIWPEA